MNDSISILLKRGVWLYFFLLIFEGALRKWFLPGLATPLLLIRDPLAIYLILNFFKYENNRPNIYVSIIWMLTILSFITTLIVGHGNIAVALFGLRITLIHFPLIFIIGKVFNKDDVIQIGKVLLWITIGMTILVAIQFFSPQSAWVNRGIGGDMEGSGFSGVAGFNRVPGTFSFTNGLSLFYGLAGAFVLYFWVTTTVKEKPKMILLIVATITLIAAIPLSLSRSVVFQLIVSFFFLLAVVGSDVRFLKKIVSTLIIGSFLVLLLQNFAFWESASDALTQRFTVANRSEGGMEGTLVDRFLGGMYGAILNPEFSFWGAGLGMGSQVGSKLLTGQQGVYLIAEGEWGRLMGEMGVIIGLSVIIIRASLVGELFVKAWQSLKEANLLPWMLMSFGTLSILQGQWGQPTSLGFTILIGGLVIASFKEK